MTTKRCSKCVRAKSLLDFYETKKGSGKFMSACKECTKSAVRANYAIKIDEKHAYEAKRNREPKRQRRLVTACRSHRQRNPEKYKARTAVNNAIRDGRLQRGQCRFCCTDKRVQAHHDDYSKPLDVKWECFKCHREKEHGQTVTATDDGRGRPVTAPI